MPLNHRYYGDITISPFVPVRPVIDLIETGFNNRAIKHSDPEIFSRFVIACFIFVNLKEGLLKLKDYLINIIIMK